MRVCFLAVLRLVERATQGLNFRSNNICTVRVRAIRPQDEVTKLSIRP